ncbi:leucine-rich repeat-containing protein 56 isoform X1 [Callorhinchus milii]|nr:leucine-rich repeat-containing protein 56 isoform X1 [Callorhinchus milii]|eukprot:gi/632981334/ref/XP_007907534.1/ PREDICTED: leucine-rich repeat-containing protein 56 [Callorhinchus milii]
MELHQDPAYIMRPGTVRVLDFGESALLNPSPVVKEEKEKDMLVEEYLSPSRLQALTETDDLQEVKVLEMRVDTQDSSLGNFGIYLPNLIELKLNNSFIVSVRDIGTSLTKLQVLWMAQCGLPDLDGIPSFSSLKELYLAYNNITDISHVSMLDHLEVLDLEGNNIDDIMQIHYLALCSQLNTITLEGNPICLKPSAEAPEDSNYNYREVVKCLIPHLKYLDDFPANETCIQANSPVGQDWLIVKEAIKDCITADDLRDLENLGHYHVSSQGRPSSGHHIHGSRRYLMQRPSTPQRPHSARRHMTACPGSAEACYSGSSDFLVQDDASDLTHGVGSIICGNPVKALQARRKKLDATYATAGSFVRQYFHGPESTFDLLEKDSKSREDIFSELKAWRNDHGKRLEAIWKDREPQILTIDHSDEEELSDGCLGEEAVKFCPETNERLSPELLCPSFLYPSPPPNLSSTADNLLTTALSQPPSPSPPSLHDLPTRSQKVLDFRVRRLRRPVQLEQVQPYSIARTEPSVVRTDEEFAVLGEEGPVTPSDGLDPKTRVEERKNTHSYTQYLRPVLGRRSTRSTDDESPQKLIDNHQPVIRSSSKTSEKPLPLSPLHPLTTKPALQRLPNRPLLLPSRGSKTTS